jgi:hypothetical protein
VIGFLFVLLACAPSSPDADKKAWQEVPPPRLDLQCWMRWGGAVVCAPSLTSTHGAAVPLPLTP